MLGAKKIPNEIAAVAPKVLQRACEMWHNRQEEEAPPPGSHETGLSRLVIKAISSVFGTLAAKPPATFLEVS